MNNIFIYTTDQRQNKVRYIHADGIGKALTGPGIAHELSVAQE